MLYVKNPAKKDREICSKRYTNYGEKYSKKN